MSLGEYKGSSLTRGLYHFNNDVTTDSSGYGYNLTNTGSVSLANLGKFNKGADFGNTNNNGKRLEIASNLGLSLTSDITVGMWIMIKAAPSGGNQRILDFRTGAGYLLIDFQYAIVPYYFRFSASGVDIKYYDTFLLNKYYFISITLSTAGESIGYINGNSIGTVTRGATAVGNTFAIGNCLAPANFNLGAIYDEFFAEQRLWSAQDMKRYYTNAMGRFGII